MSEKILSISIAAYNVETVINDCLDSICLCQYIDDLDVIIVDDGSIDKTVEIVNSYVHRFPSSIKLIEKENGGHGSTINVSLNIARGKYFKVLDGDDWIDPTELDKFIKFLKNATIDLVINPFNEIYNDRVNLVSILKNLKSNFPYSLKDLEELDYLPMHSITVKLDTYKRCNLNISEHRFYVDTEFVYFVLSSIQSVIFRDDIVYQYRLDQLNQSVSWSGLYSHIEDYIDVLKRLILLYETSEIDNIYRRKILFRLLNSRYKLLFYWYTNFSMSDKDYLLMSTDKELLDKHSKLLTLMDLGIYRVIRINYLLLLSIFRFIRKICNWFKQMGRGDLG